MCCTLSVMTAHLTLGSPAPAFTLPNAEGVPVSLSDHPSHTVIVYFYPVAMAPNCITQAMDFTGMHAAFVTAGYTIIGISPDTIERLTRLMAGSKIGFPLPSDPRHKALSAYGTLGTRRLYGKGIEGVLRSTFVVGVDVEGDKTI